MGIIRTLSEELSEVDVIIAGGGLTGCIVAARLSDADPELSVLVVEAGADNYQDPTVVHPVLFTAHLAPTSTRMVFHRGAKSAATAQRDMVVPCGSVLGGGSSVNMMMYSRPQRADLDAWATPGWTADDLLPYLKKFETYHAPDPTSVHGTAGPIHVSDGPLRCREAEDDYIQAFTAVTGRPEVLDLQDLDSANGVQRVLRYVSPDGKRQDTAHAYIHPRVRDGRHENLHVLVETQVERVLLEGTRAVGVVVRSNPVHQPDAAMTRHTIRARKLVVVSCGNCGSPGVLERSGIGGASVLRAAGVGPVVVDLPGVGSDFQDHQLTISVYRSSMGLRDTGDAMMQGIVDPIRLATTGDPFAGWNLMDNQVKYRPTDDEVASVGKSAFQEAWARAFRDVPNKPLAIFNRVNGCADVARGPPEGRYMSNCAFLTYPFSRGRIHITGPGLDDPLDLDLGLLTDPDDADLLAARMLYNVQRDVMRRMRTYRGELPATHPAFAPTSRAACVELDGPLPEDAPACIEYSTDDDVAIDCWVRENVATAWHSLGTCKMASRDKGGVVDATLGVHGLQALKVADLSIAPGNVGCNTAATTYTIAEKAADIFIQELGLGEA